MQNIPKEYFFSSEPYPARIIQPLASQLASELTNYNWWGRTTLHLREADDRIAHLQGLILGAKLAISKIESRKQELRTEKKELEAVTKLYESMKQELRSHQKEEQKLHQENEIMKNNRIVKAGMEYQSKMSQRRSFSGAAASSSAQNSPSQPPTLSHNLLPILVIIMMKVVMMKSMKHLQEFRSRVMTWKKKPRSTKILPLTWEIDKTRPDRV